MLLKLRKAEEKRHPELIPTAPVVPEASLPIDEPRIPEAQNPSQEGLVGCSVSTDPGHFAEFGAHRAPYETDLPDAEPSSGEMSQPPAESNGITRPLPRPFDHRGSHLAKRTHPATIRANHVRVGKNRR